ncbi:MAG: putative membrane protein YkoI [Motiliproteus sp.]|jgi:uncharacterized membrane protein YkoI
MLNRRLGLVPLLLWSLSASSVMAIESYEMLDAKACRTLVDKNSILPMADIVARTHSLADGQILDAMLLKNNPLLIYQIEMLGADGVVRTLYIDARDGTLASEYNNGRLDADSPR